MLALSLVATCAPFTPRRQQGPTPRFEPPVLVGVGRNGAGFQGFPLTAPLNATLIIGTLGLAHQANTTVVVSRDSGRSFQPASAEAAAFLAANRTDSSKWVPAGSTLGVFHDLGSLGAEGRGKQTGATRLGSPFVNTLTTTAGGGFTLKRRATSELSVSWPIPWGAPQYPEGGAIVFPMSQTPVKLRSGGLAQAWVALVNGECAFESPRRFLERLTSSGGTVDSISERSNPLWNAALRTRYGIFLAVADAQGLRWSYRATIANASHLPASREGERTFPVCTD